MTPEEQIKQLSDENEELKKRLEAASPSAITDKDIAVAKAVADSPSGLQYSEIQASTSFSHARVEHHVERLIGFGFIRAYGGGSEPMRYKLDKPGRNYLAANDLI